MPTPNDPTRTSRWPTGTTFVMYCAGVSLLLLVTYVITSGKLFEFSANESGVAFKSVLSNGNVPADSVASRSKELQAKFAQASLAQQEATPPAMEVRERSISPTLSSRAATMVSAPQLFAGTWTGQGSTYKITQTGQNIALEEWTNQILTSYGTGTVSGERATLTVNNIVGLTLQVELTIANGKLEVSSSGQTFQLDRS